MQSSIMNSVLLNAPISNVWNALIEYGKFGEWFGVKLEGPFVVGQLSQGKIIYPGYEHVSWEAVIQEIKPECLFSFTWHPYAIDPAIDYSKEIPTLVEFKLEEFSEGTLVSVFETGFEKIPSYRQDDAYQMNLVGWAEQMKNIKKYIAEK